MKKHIYECGLYIGRFEHFHNGHEYVVSKALDLSKKLLILISDSDTKADKDNPFSIELREKIIKEIYGDKVIIGRLKKSSNDINYREYAVNVAREYIGKNPDYIIYGSDLTKNTWYNTNKLKNIEEIVVPREDVDISATKVRELIIKDEKEKWKKHVNKKIYKYYDRLKEEIINII